MQFELTEALIDNILFSMEDQAGLFFVDTRQGIVVSEEEMREDQLLEDEAARLPEDEDEEGRYIDLPQWNSSDGYRLMEKFAAGYKNSLVRQELSAALDRGKGVFRAFKDTLSRRPEAEKLWFLFKEREMKKEVIQWYNGLREEWGLERIGGEPEETADLVLEDFIFRCYRESDFEALAELHSYCFAESVSQANSSLLEAADAVPGGKDLLREAVSHAQTVTAETGKGEFAGFCAAFPVPDCRSPEDAGALAGSSPGKAGPILMIKLLEVKPEYRGLGVGKTLLTKLLDKAAADKAALVLLDLPAGAEYFSRVLGREAFSPLSVRYYCDPAGRTGDSLMKR